MKPPRALVFGILVALVCDSIADELPRNAACYLHGNRVIAISKTEITIVDDGGRKVISLADEYESIVPVPGTDYVFLVESDQNKLLDLSTGVVYSGGWLPNGKICTTAALDDSKILIAIWSRVPVVKRVIETEIGVLRARSNSSELVVMEILELKKSIEEKRDPKFDRIKLKEDSTLIPTKITVGEKGFMIQMVSAAFESRRGKHRLEKFAITEVLLVDRLNNVRELFTCEIPLN